MLRHERKILKIMNKHAKNHNTKSITLTAPDAEKTLRNPRGLSRGDVVYVIGNKESCTGKERWPNRPAVIMSKTENITCESTVQIVYLSHVLKPGRYNVNVSTSEGTMVRACCDQCPCVDYSRIGNFLYKINTAEMYGVSKAVSDFMDLSVDNHAADIREFENINGRKSHASEKKIMIG